MKRMTRFVTAGTLVCAVVMTLLAGCSGQSGAEADGRKLGEIQCRATKLVTKSQSGDMSILQESLKLTAEAAELTKSLESKYTSQSDKEKLRDAYLKALSECK